MATSVPASTPSISVLIKAVTSKYNETKSADDKPLDTTEGIFTLKDKYLNAKISDDTLRRLLGLKPGYKSVRKFTLDVLSRYVGYADWEDFNARNADAEGVQSYINTNNADIVSAKLSEGDRVELSWLPDRKCLLEYMGENKYKVLESINSSTLAESDTLCFSAVTLGEPLKADNLQKSGVVYKEVILGKKDGISYAKKIGTL
ncbi:MAG: hypothetical protein MJ010_03950 [Paludibacteraceae bacterium]|nr:hypothetical protein [Paludibacteraceae bacterium]